LDGKLTFEAAHSYERMADPRVRAVQARVNLIGDPKFAELERKRPGQVRVQMEDGRVFEKLVPAVRGTADNPMSREEVEVKSLDLLEGILGKRSKGLVEKIWSLEKLKSLRELRSFLSVP
jgi:2-methylcitrate dehydratase PrpD